MMSHTAVGTIYTLRVRLPLYRWGLISVAYQIAVAGSWWMPCAFKLLSVKITTFLQDPVQIANLISAFR